MPITFQDIDFHVELPDIPHTTPVVVHDPPCLRDSRETVGAIARVLDIDLKGTAQVPHGFAAGSDRGQVEVFSASGAFRARNVDRLAAYEDERRRWHEVERDDDGTYRLSGELAERATLDAREILERIGLTDEYAGIDVSLEQWALLDERGAELDSGPGRATVRFSYAVEGLPLIGPGAKTNLHFDPDGEGVRGVLARMFHVHRRGAAVGEVETQPLEAAFEQLLAQQWSAAGIRPGEGRMRITGARLGLLALPADVVQTYAAPVLEVQGEVSGIEVGRDETETVHFGHYLPLVDPRVLAEAGHGGGTLQPGSLVKGRRIKGR